jgi:Bacterial Ig domain
MRGAMRRRTPAGRLGILLAVVVAAGSWILPARASAQLPGNLIVTLTSPGSGSTVSGTIPVSAEVTLIGGLTVRGLQFKLDGTNLGAEDTAAPYSVAWGTSTASNGSHTLTAVARDALGLLWTSNPVTVTVANDVTRLEETLSAVTYTGTWEQGNTERAWSGGTAAVSSEASARATLTFTGTGVSWIGYRGPGGGIARIVLDGRPVATVDSFATTEEGPAELFTAGALAAAQHTLAIEVTGDKNAHATGSAIAVDAFDVRSNGGDAAETFARGDVVVSLETGPVQWRHPDGTLNRVLGGTIPGTGEGLAFDAAGNLHVTRWCIDPSCTSTGNTVEQFDVHGRPRGPFGSGYDCSPHAIVFDQQGTAYVGQAGCTGAILKLVPGEPPTALAAAPEAQGSFWVDLAADGCTIHYTSWGPNVKRYDGCADVQRPDFNVAPLPGGETQDLRVLPNGGLLVSSGDVIARLDASGALVQTYAVPGVEFWAGLALVGDGTFWAGSYESSTVHRFDIATGNVLSSFHTGTPPHTVVGVDVKR